MKSYEIIEGDFGLQDHLYEDGSKSYETIIGDRIYIERPEVVGYIDNILSGNFTGFSYMSTVDDLLKSGKITQIEYKQIVKILD